MVEYSFCWTTFFFQNKKEQKMKNIIINKEKNYNKKPYNLNTKIKLLTHNTEQKDTKFVFILFFFWEY